MPICFRLLMHWDRRAASRAACTAGNNSAISTAMIAMTTSSSMSVNARRRGTIALLRVEPDEQGRRTEMMAADRTIHALGPTCASILNEVEDVTRPQRAQIHF